VQQFAIFVPIVVALIAGPVMFMLHRFEKKNDQQHADNGKALGSLAAAIKEQHADIRDIKADVIDLKADHRHLRHDHRLLSSKLNKHLEDA